MGIAPQGQVTHPRGERWLSHRRLLPMLHAAGGNYGRIRLGGGARPGLNAPTSYQACKRASQVGCTCKLSSFSKLQKLAGFLSTTANVPVTVPDRLHLLEFEINRWDLLDFLISMTNYSTTPACMPWSTYAYTLIDVRLSPKLCLFTFTT